MAVLRQTLWWIFILVVLCVFLGVGTLAALRYHDGLRDQVLLRVLKPYGVQSISTQLDALAFDHATLGALSVSYQKDNLAAHAKVQQIQIYRADSSLPYTDPKSWSLTLEAGDATITTRQSDNSADTAQALTLASFLPQAILQQIPLAIINANALSLEYQPAGGDSWRYQGQAHLSPQKIQSQFQLHHGEQPFNGELLLNQESVDITLGQSDQPWVSVQSRLDLVDSRLVAGGTLAISDLTHTEDWLALMPLELPETVNWQGSLDLAFTLGVPEARLQEWLTGNTQNLEGVTLAAQVRHDLKLGVPGLDLKQLAARGSANVQLSGDSLQVKPWELEHGMVSKNITDPDMQKRLALTRPGTASLSTKGQLAELQLTLPNKLPESVAGKLRLTLKLPEKPALSGVSSFNTARTQAGNLKGKASVLLEDLTAFQTGFTYLPNEQAMDFKIDSEKTNLATATFNEWAQKLELPFQLELGDFSMAMEGRLDLNRLEQARVQGRLEVSDWHGNLEKNHFESLTSQFAFSGDLNHFSVKGQVKNGLFDVGIPITDIRYDLAIDGDTENEHFQVTVTNLESKLVGGLVRIPEFAWDNQQQETQFNVVIFNWQFAQIIELLDRQDLEVSGILDGMLPIYLADNGFEIREGRLTARQPGGVIRYKPAPDMKAYLSNQQQLKMAVDILENFHYQTLDAKVNQELDGTQFINLTLKGKNPDMAIKAGNIEVRGGTPANLNLNIEHNINPLLESLTLPGKIQENWKNLDTVQQ